MAAEVCQSSWVHSGGRLCPLQYDIINKSFCGSRDVDACMVYFQNKNAKKNYFESPALIAVAFEYFYEY